MGLFGKKEASIPNYKTVPSQNGPVIDVFCLDGEGYNTINADDNLLFLSGMTYWKMQLTAYGCDKDPNAARSNASRFFIKLWDNKYYEKQPLIGWYIALYSVYHNNTWSDIARQAMKVFCEYFFRQKDLHTMDSWHVSMMYISLCGGSIDDVVGWLHGYLENILSKKLIWEGASLVLPVLKHYKVLQGLVHQVPFDTPEAGGTLEGYWDYLADKFMCEDARLEATFLRLFLAHSPYKHLTTSKDDAEYRLDPEVEAERAGVKEDAALFNEAAKNGNPLALPFVRQKEWVYETSRNKAKYPSFDNLVLANDDYMRKNRLNVLPQLYSKADATADRLASIGLALKQAEKHFAKALYQVAAGENFYDEMKKATSYAEGLYDVKLPVGKLNAAVRAAACISLVFKESFPFLTKADMESTSKVEKLAISCRKNPTELKFRQLGILLRDGFKGMHPQPDLWDKFRDKGLAAAKDYGITKYVLDDTPDVAENQFRAIIENGEQVWSEEHITGAWLGLAWLRYAREDYSDLSELVTFLQRYDGFEPIIERHVIDYYIRSIKDNDLLAIEPLAGMLALDKRVHNDDPVLLDMGRLVARYLGCQHEKQMEACEDTVEKLVLMTKVVDVEMSYAGYAPRLLDYIVTGLSSDLEYFYGLLECKEVYNAVYAAVNLKPMLDFVKAAVANGCNLKEQLAELEKKWDESEIHRILTEKRNKSDYSAPKSRQKSPWDEAPSLVDILMDADERSHNEDGMTNEELYYTGKRSELDHERDAALREGLKNPWGLFGND